MLNGVYTVIATDFFNDYYRRTKVEHIFPSEEEAKRSINEEIYTRRNNASI